VKPDRFAKGQTSGLFYCNRHRKYYEKMLLSSYTYNSRPMRLLSILLLFCFSNMVSAQSDSTWLTVSLLTCDSGAEAYASFGHSAIRVVDRKRNKDIVFDYGVFDFDTPNFVWRFMRGNLDYKLALRRTNRFMREYVRDKRGVIEQKFNLPERALVEMYDFLLQNQKPENRYYKYNFIHDNCSTRIRDLVNGLDVKKGNPVTRLEDTYRNFLHDYLPNKPWLKLGIDILLGAKTDRVMNYDQQMFLPNRLSRSLSYYVYENEGSKQKMLSPATNLVPPQKMKSDFIFFQPLIVFIALLLLLIGLVWWQPRTSKWLFYFFGLIYGLAGCLLVFLWFFTEHTATANNWNLLWLHPLYLLFFLPSKGLKSILTKVVLVLNVGVLLFWWQLPQEINLGVLPLVGMYLFLLVENRHKGTV